MASAAVLVGKIQAASQFGSALPQTPVPPGWVRRALVVIYVPRVLRFITDHLGGEELGRLSPSEAMELVQPVADLHSALTSLISEISSHRFQRLLLRRWLKRVGAENERLGDILESLTWGTEPDLRGYLDSALAAIEPRI